ncbi:hypothetical protein B0T22DRAFT_512669 [Podospora appendiculata]|uniref:Uncharacterized protein n=1 Tax=Podospora appendiculata TaxID=314037 RepID=A0AAE1CCS9_9PEZI|nr:hypothetical protein B0T22DRAFT_512669 [Podospora appendiculata]
MAISQLPALKFGALAIATIFVAFGTNAIVRPANALTFFEPFSAPTDATDAQTVAGLLAVYGARDIFMGVAIYAAAFLGTARSLGCTLLAASAVAGFDGFVCYTRGGGHWSHWGYAPIVGVLGGLLTGLLDGGSGK